jgi:hypothetical protein
MHSVRHSGRPARKVVTGELSIKSRSLERAMGFEPTTPTLARLSMILCQRFPAFASHC